METGSERPWAERFLLMGDAFLYAAALDILVSSVFMVIAASTGFADSDVSPTSAFAIAMQGGFMIAAIVVIAFGAFTAWRQHGRAVGTGVGIAMVLGVIVGFSVAMPVFGALAFLLSRIPTGLPDGPPWLAIGLLVVVVAALLVLPLMDSVKDLRGMKAHTRADWMRIGALAVVVGIAGIALPVIGAVGQNEVAEAGIFMVPFSAAAAFAVLGADLYAGFRDRQATHTPASTV